MLLFIGNAFEIGSSKTTADRIRQLVVSAAVNFHSRSHPNFRPNNFRWAKSKGAD